MSRRILLINQYFPPDIASTGHIAEAVCEGIAASGAWVTAIVGQPSYATLIPDAPANEARGRLTIRRVPMGRYRGRGNLAIRLLGYARFLCGAWLESRRQVRPDVVVTFHNPPLLGLLGALLARKYGVPFIYVVQDIHPDILVRTGSPSLPRWLIAIWRRLSHMTLHKSMLTITLSEAMKDYLVKTYGLAADAVIPIPLWAQPNLEHLPTDVDAMRHARETLALGLRSDEEIVVLYAGNMGVMHPVEILVLAAARVRSLPISFLFVGDGVKRGEVERLSEQLALDNVHFLPFQPLREFELLVQAADMCAVVLETGLENLCLPSRTPTFMSAGRPILAVMSERAPQSRELTQMGAGWCANSVEGVARLLESLVDAPDRLAVAGSAARSLYRQRYRRETLVRCYVNAILDIAPREAEMPRPPQRHSRPHPMGHEQPN